MLTHTTGWCLLATFISLCCGGCDNGVSKSPPSVQPSVVVTIDLKRTIGKVSRAPFDENRPNDTPTFRCTGTAPEIPARHNRICLLLPVGGGPFRQCTGNITGVSFNGCALQISIVEGRPRIGSPAMRAPNWHRIYVEFE